MNWKLVIALSLFGVLAGVASLFGINLADPIILLIAFLGSAWIIAGLVTSRHFLHGFAVGVLGQVWLSLFNAYYLFDMSRQGLGEVLPGGQHPQIWYLMLGLLIALIKGLILGLFALVGARFVGRNKPSATKAIS